MTGNDEVRGALSAEEVEALESLEALAEDNYMKRTSIVCAALRRLLLQSPPSVSGEWLPIESAPRDGTQAIPEGVISALCIINGCEHMRSLMDARQSSVGAWVAVSERLPEDDYFTLLVSNGVSVWPCDWNRDGWDTDAYTAHEITHWQHPTYPPPPHAAPVGNEGEG